MKKKYESTGVAVHLHLHYTDLLPTMLFYIRNIPFGFKLFVTITDPVQFKNVLKLCKQQLPLAEVAVHMVENKGRDVKPFYTDLGKELAHYDFVCHIHAKKSLFNNGSTNGWLDHLLDRLMGTPEIVQQIFDKFNASPEIGLVYPSNFHGMPYWANSWLSNRGYAARLQEMLEIKSLPHSYFSFPVGNMFWARVEAIKPLFTIGLKDEDYPGEAGQLDGEIMHSLERITPIISANRGYKNLVIEKDGDELYFRNDKDGVDMSAYFAGSLQQLKQLIDDPSLKIISFDIFDTLICRRILQPADLFDMMQDSFEQECGGRGQFRQVRMQADAGARAILARDEDVTLDAIYTFIGKHQGIAEEKIDQLKALELSLELRFMERRESLVAMLDHAYDNGKRVILTSDMYMPGDEVQYLLSKLSVTKYHKLYVSSQEGRRKDNRTLFPHIIEREGVDVSAMLHIGDNEHSDLQIPGDLRIRTFHVLRPAELFAKTKWGTVVSGNVAMPRSLYENVSLAMALNKIFDNPFPRGNSFVNADLHLFGYYYFGQLLLSFVKWVIDKAAADKIERLYFLSRDGEILYKIYQLIRKYSAATLPEAKYIEVSRRSIAMPMVTTRQQADRILTPDFFSGTLQQYFRVRMSIDIASAPGLDLAGFGFNSIEQSVTVPADLEKIKVLAYYLLELYQPWFAEQRQLALRYLNEHHFFDDAKKAVVDIGYSGTMQNLLNQVSVDPVDGYYMITYKRIDTAVDRPGAKSTGWLGDRIDPQNNDLPVDRYSLFYEMILSAVNGSVSHYLMAQNGRVVPVFEKVSPKETQKVEKLPVIHSGILAFCEEYLSVMGDESITWHNTAALYKPFIYFLEHPQRGDLDMMAGYSIDDSFCGNDILYWAPGENGYQESGNNRRFLWRYMVSPFEPGGSENYFSRTPEKRTFTDPQERTIRQWYHGQYEIMPGWYKLFGQLFKIAGRKKKLVLSLKDANTVTNHASKVEEIQAFYQKEYEVLPLWYKRFGHIVQVTRGKKKISDLF